MKNRIALHLKMSTMSIGSMLRWGALTAAVLSVSACANKPVLDPIAQCTAPLPQRLELAIAEAETRLAGGCQAQYETLLERLLVIGEGDPKLENKQLFSGYFSNLSNAGTVSPRQARETYTRYFGTKFVSGLNDYNTCSAICPIEDEVLSNMRLELQEKSRGFLKISSDPTGYARVNKLHAELELNFSAVCLACAKR